MQEEIENRTVTLIISAVKLTARELKAGMDKYLSEKKSKAMEKARAAPEKPSGKQTVRQLIGQNQGVSNIEITNSNIKSFERVARNGYKVKIWILFPPTLPPTARRRKSSCRSCKAATSVCSF